MEENNKKVSVKISKIWWIIGILVVIVIVANVYVITNNKNQTSDDKNFNAEKQANAVSTRIEKVEETKRSSDKIDEVEVKKAFQDYLNLIGVQEGSPREMLIELGVIKDYDNETSAGKDGFIKTDVKYSDFKEKMLDYVTEKCYENEFSEFYIEEDGYLCYANVGATGVTYDVKNISANKEVKNGYSATALWKQEETEENVEFDFVVEYNSNGKIVIDYVTEHEEKGKEHLVLDESETDNQSDKIDDKLGRIENTENYKEITKELDEDYLFELESEIKNDNGTYTLYGKIITVDTSKKQIAEFPFYKETGEYKKITLSSDTKYKGEYYNEEEGYLDEINDTVENVFSKKLNEKDGVNIAYTFEFKNGKCISIEEVETGH